MAYDSEHPDQLILRDHLALDRTRLANERTFLAYVRTAMMFLLAGGTVIKFFGDSEIAHWSGWGLIAVGVIVGAFGIVRFLKMRRHINRRPEPPH